MNSTTNGTRRCRLACMVIASLVLVAAYLATPMSAQAVETYNLYVSGIQVTSDNASDVLGDRTVSYDATTNTLTLNGARLEAPASGDDVALRNNMDELTIQLMGDNTATSSRSRAIYSIGATSLTFVGVDGGTLAATSPVGNAIQIDNGADAIIDGCTIWANSGDGGGLLAPTGNLKIQNNANVYVEGDQNPTTPYSSSALVGRDGITISDSYVEVFTSAGEANAIHTDGSISIENSTVEVALTSDPYYPALYCIGSATITNSTIEAECAANKSIYVLDSLTVADSRVTATSTEDTAIYVATTLSIANSTVTATSGDPNGSPAIYAGPISVSASTVTARGGLRPYGALYIEPTAGKLVELKVDEANYDGSAAAHYDGGGGSPYNAATTVTGSGVEQIRSYRYVYIGEHVHEGVVATCSAPATCDDCGRAYGTTDPNNHAWGEPTWSWAEDGSACTATITCAHDASHTQTAQATITSSVQTPATCTEQGVTAYAATVTVNGTTYTSTKTLANIPALGHSFENGACTVCGAADPDTQPAKQDADNNLVATGDESSTLAGTLLAVGAAAVTTGAILRRKAQSSR